MIGRGSSLYTDPIMVESFLAGADEAPSILQEITNFRHDSRVLQELLDEVKLSAMF